jgi:hypothetical protein
MDAERLVESMSRGDPAAWPDWRPEPMSFEAVAEALARALTQHAHQVGTLNVYAHFVHCAVTCRFCQYYHYVPEGKQLDDYVEHLCELLARYRQRFGRLAVTHAYFGGGTPSLLDHEPLRRLLTAFGRSFSVSHEFTVEGHPLTLDADKLAILAAGGVRRVSIGVQSLDRKVTRVAGRANPAASDIAELVRAAQARDLTVNLDLVLGLPEQDLDSFRDDVRVLADMQPDTITIYPYHPVVRLPVEPGPEMVFSRALTPALRGTLLRAGFVAQLRADDAAVVMLRRVTSPRLARTIVATLPLLVRAAARGHGLVPNYSIFSYPRTHTIPLGSGAFGHVYGWGWFRDVTHPHRGGEPVYLGTRLDLEDERRTELRARLLGLGFVPRDSRLTRDAQTRAVLEQAVERGELRVVAGLYRVVRRGELARLLADLSPAGPLVIDDTRTPARCDPGLVRALVVPGDQRALRRWCTRLGLQTGKRFEGATLERLDFARGDMVFRVEPRDHPPLRLFVQPDDGTPAHGVGAGMSIKHASRPEPLTQRERAFLDRLIARAEADLG